MAELPPPDVMLTLALRRAHVLEAMVRVHEDLSALLAVVESSASSGDAQQQVADRFGLDRGQATAVLDMQVRRMSVEGREQVRKEYDQLQEEISRLRRLC